MTCEKQDSSFLLNILTCPITLELFIDPVLASDGHTYERSAIVEWLKYHHGTSPMTRQTIKIKDLTTNRIVKQLADRYRSSIPIGNGGTIFEGNGTLLNDEQKLNITELFSKGKKWLLIYKGTRDGFEANNFHHHCDNRGPTLTLIQTRHLFHAKNHDSIFGGYTTIPWSSQDGSYRDSNSFLFLLSEDKATRFNIRSSEKIAVSHNIYSGPIFGRDDIHICHQANENHYSFSRFPSSYEDPIGKGRKTFTKWKHFLVSEIEVYMVVM